jgi:hypothetical protein
MMQADKRWLSISEAAGVAHRSERTLRNWVRDGVLAPAIPGLFDRDRVIAAEKAMRTRRGRPALTEPRAVEVATGSWIKVVACGKHRSALAAGLLALDCERCRRVVTGSPKG